MSIGDEILNLAPEAAAIIEAELGVDITLLNGDDSVACHGANTQQEVIVSITGQGQDVVLPKDDIREIWLGEHTTLGSLQARLPDWDVAYDTVGKRPVATVLVPEFFQALSEDVDGVQRVTHRGTLDPADTWPRGHLVEILTQSYDGLAWPDDGSPGEGFFTRVCELAVATLWHHADIAVLSGGAVQCDLTSSFIRDVIDGNTAKEVRVTDGSEGGCSDAAWDWQLHLMPLPPAAGDHQFFTDRESGWVGARGYNATAGGNKITMCGSLAGRAARVDYLIWWASQLYQHAKSCTSIWYMFMAILCARNAVSDIVRIASLLLHELGHAAIAGGHCINGCCSDRAMHFFNHVLLSMYGLPFHTSDANRFNTEIWSKTGHGSIGCGASVFTVETEHCALLRPRHAVHQVVTVDASCGGGVAILEDYEFFTPTASFTELEGTDAICW